LNTWSRSRYQALPLQQLHYFVIFGDIDESLPPLDSDRYRSIGVPEGVEMEFASRMESAELWEQFQKGPAWESLQSSSSSLGEAISQSPTCVVVRGQIADGDSLEPLANIVGVITALLDTGGHAVYDVLTATWFDSLTWRLSVFEPGLRGLSKLVVVHQEATKDNGYWLYTSGMRRFARPDVSFRHVQPSLVPACQKIVEYLVDGMLDGAVVPNGKILSFKASSEERDELNVRCDLAGGLDDQHFYNFYLEISIISK